MLDDLHDLKCHLQAFLTDGLAVVVGSGLSCAEGLPGMAELGRHLQAEVSRLSREEDGADWRAISDLIDDRSLEPALLAHPPGPELEAVIVDSTARMIARREAVAIAEVFAGRRRLRLTALLPHLLKPETGIPIVTTNYDRLVEVAVEEAGLGVDTMFVGAFAGRLDEAEARMGHCRGVRQVGRRAQLDMRPRAVVSKPHGSLDWYHRGGSPVRYAGELEGVARLIVPPGRNKFRTGYDPPFDRQRERANRAIDEAGRLLIIGYGFADAHLETHLTPALRRGLAALVLTYELSPEARRLAVECPALTAVERAADDRVRVYRAGTSTEYVAPPIWDLGHFVREVLEP